jgi:xylulokinase
MPYVLGIDLGTGSVKTLVAELPRGRVVGVSQESYGYALKDAVRAEQDPDVLLESTLRAIREALRCASVPGDRIVAVGLSGQMHGTVLYSADGDVLGNIVTWEDQRVSPELLEEIRRLGKGAANRSGCGIAAGYCGPTLFALKRHDKGLYRRVRHVLFPTDWLRRELTGCGFSTATSNGSSSGFFDTECVRWNVPLLNRLGIEPRLFPGVKQGYDVGGSVTRGIARRTGLKEGTPVSVGGGDQPMSMIGSGICRPGGGIIVNIGTGGQVAMVRKKYMRHDELITFCFPGGGYSVLGATLSAGAALRWWENMVAECAEAARAKGVLRKGGAYETMSRAARNAAPGAGGVRFLPLLAGSRVRPTLKGSFRGLNPNTGLAEMTRAVMEGVTFELYRLYRMFRLKRDHEIVGAGGGFSSRVWGRIAADVFGNTIRLTTCQEQAALGAALLAGVMAGFYGSLDEACRRVRFKTARISPVAANVSLYRRIWRESYRDLFETPTD